MMRGEVNKIVFNELVSGRALWLPDVGSFVPEYRSALRTSSRCLEPPGRRVAFLSGRNGGSLIDLIARMGGCDLAVAEDIYARWLAQVRTPEGLEIEGVGRLEHRYFNAAEPLDAMLSPLGREPLSLRPRRSHVVLWATCGLIAAAFVVYGVRWYGARDRAAAGAVTDGEVLFALSDAEPQKPAVEAAAAEDFVAEAVVAEAAAADTVAGTELLPAEPTGRGAESTGEGSEAAESLSATEVAAAGKSVEEQPDALPVARMQAGRTYVVWGVYSTEENARRAVAEHRHECPDLSHRIYRFGPKWMVSIFESDAAGECRAYINREGRGLEGLWPYTKKG